MPLEIKQIEVAEFHGLRDEWNELLSRSPADNVFLRWEWIHTWWSIFEPKRQLFIFTARREGRLMGIAPLYLVQGGPLRTRSLHLCSEGLSPDYLDFIADKEEESEIIQELLGAIVHRASEWDILSLEFLRQESRLLSDRSILDGLSHTTRHTDDCPYIEIQGRFDDYYRSRSTLVHFIFDKKWKTLREKKNVTYQVAADERSVTDGLNDLFALHDKRADDKEVRSNFTTPKVQEFHHQVALQFLKEGILDLQLLYENKIPISAIYALHYKGKVSMFQTGFDPAWRKWSAGAVLVYLAIEKAFREGCKEFDFLKGIEHYKTLWTDKTRAEMRLTVFSQTPRARIHRAWSQVRPVLKKVKSHLAGV